MGGNWLSQNKVRPGAYINFKSVPRPSMVVGDRGIGTMALPLTWGATGELIEVHSTDLLDGTSLAKVGVTAFDEETEPSAKLLTLMLSGCYLAKVYRLDIGGSKATATIGTLTATAAYAGTFGNKITISATENNGTFTVTTFVNGASQDTQTVATLQELESNAFVRFSGEGTPTANAGTPLTGGTNGTYTAATAYPAYTNIASRARWQAMAVPFDGATVNAQIAEFAKTMRDGEGRYIQVALANYDDADYHGVINSDCGVRRANDEVNAEEATAWVAGITAGASIVQSNVGKVFPGALSLMKERSNSEIIAALQAGKFILSANQRGEIVIENDINSLHTFTPELNEDWSLNQVVRVMDEIGTSLSDIWEQRYKGKVQNNADGRGIFKAEIIGYMFQLQNLGAIDEFLGAEDIDISRGTALDAVLADLRAKAIVAVSKLYMTVRLQG